MVLDEEISETGDSSIEYDDTIKNQGGDGGVPKNVKTEYEEDSSMSDNDFGEVSESGNADYNAFADEYEDTFNNSFDEDFGSGDGHNNEYFGEDYEDSWGSEEFK